MFTVEHPYHLKLIMNPFSTVGHSDPLPSYSTYDPKGQNLKDNYMSNKRRMNLFTRF